MNYAGGIVPLYQDEKFVLLFAESFAKVLAIYTHI